MTDMVNRKVNTCWDYMGCPEETRGKCVVFKLDSGADCWDYMDVKGAECPAIDGRIITNCTECPFFKKMNPGFEGSVKKSEEVNKT